MTLITFLHDNWMLATVFTLAVIAFVGITLFEKASGTTLLSPEAVIDLINHKEGVIVDVRDRAAFAKGHILDAINVELSAIADSKKLLDLKTRPLVLVCAEGLNSAKAGIILRKQGFSQVFVLKQGLISWANSGCPLVKK